MWVQAADLEASWTKNCQRALSWVVSAAAGLPPPESLGENLKPLPLITDTVVVLVVRDGKLLYGRREGAEGSGTWGILGGKIEHQINESLSEAARRELREEAGLELARLEWVGVDYVYQKENETRYRVFIMVAEAEGEPSRQESQITAFRWSPLREPPEPLFSPNRQWLERRFSQLEGVLARWNERAAPSK